MKYTSNRWSRGEYFYSSLQAFENRQNCDVNDAVKLLNCPSFYQGVGLNNVPLFTAATLKPNYQTGSGLYWQDKWQPNHRLTVTYGLRWDLTRNPQPQSPTPGQQVYVGVGPIGRGHYGVLVGWDPDRNDYVVNDGRSRPKRMGRDDLMRRWRAAGGQALVVRPPAP